MIEWQYEVLWSPKGETEEVGQTVSSQGVIVQRWVLGPELCGLGQIASRSLPL